MRFRRKDTNENVQNGGNPQAGLPGGDNLDNLRRAGEQLLAAGDVAINKAISQGNSEAFLAANRQAGGQ